MSLGESVPGLCAGCLAVNTVLPGLDRLLKVHNERGCEQLSGRPAPPLLVLFTADFLLGPVPACLPAYEVDSQTGHFKINAIRLASRNSSGSHERPCTAYGI